MVTWDDFEKIWASTSPLTPYEFSDPNYSQGWNFVGSTPPARQMWDSIQKKNDEKFKYLRDNFGTPNIVTSSSQMTDTEKVYVYMGSEAGWNSGHWYYYDDGTSSWADGGVYNSVAFVTDTTLSIAGQPADAKATGDALALKADLAGCTFTGNVNVSADLSVTGTSTLAGDVTASSDLSVAGDSALTNLSVSGTTALAGTSTAPTPSADDNSTKIATTEYVQTEIKPIETDVDIAEKDIANIKALLQGHLYDYQTDNSSAYTKSVLAGAMPYAGLESLGGKTVVWNQLFQVKSAITSEHQITFTISNGVVTTSGTADADFWTSLGTWDYLSPNDGDKILFKGFPSGGSLDTFYINIALPGWKSKYEDFIVTYSDSGANSFRLYIKSGTNMNGKQFAMQAINLTKLFGAGNEPSTVAEFEAVFPASYYPYNAGTLLSAGVTSVVSKDSNNATLQIYSIPASIQALEGYGWSAGTAYNYVDFERKVFVQNVGRVDLGSLSWTRNDTSYDYAFFSSNTIAKYKGGTTNIIAPIYTVGTNRTVLTSNMMIAPFNSTQQNITVRNDTYTDAPTFTTAMNGVYMYYELATPVETDISEYLTDDNLIQVEAGGTLTFENQHGDDYRLPVPSEETYMIDLQEAINNG